MPSFLLPAELPEPEPKVRDPGCTEFNSNTPTDFGGSRFSLPKATGVLKHFLAYREKGK